MWSAVRLYWAYNFQNVTSASLAYFELTAPPGTKLCDYLNGESGRKLADDFPEGGTWFDEAGDEITTEGNTWVPDRARELIYFPGRGVGHC